MPSELQRVAQSLVECLDQVPQVVAYLQQTATRLRQQASWIADLSWGNPYGRQAALLLHDAARRCDEAAYRASLAPAKATVWAQTTVGGGGGGSAGGGTAGRDAVPGSRVISAKAAHTGARGSSSSATVAVKSGRPGAWNTQLDNPDPDTTYVVDDRYSFTTDSQSRVVLVEGTLAVGAKARSEWRQRAAGGSDRKVDLDDGGHIIGNQFMGPSEAINLVAQLRSQNQPSALDQANWYAMERRWSEAISGTPPQAVDVSISIRYPENSARPSSFRVRYRIGNGDWVVRRFKN